MSETTMSTAESSDETFKPGDISGARDAVQNAVQWLARMSSSFATADDFADDDGPQIYWDGDSRRFLTPEVAPGVVVGLSLPHLILQFDEQGAPSPHPIDIEGKSSTEIEAWLLCEMLHRHFDRDKFSKNLPYAWDRLMSGDEAKYSPEAQLGELKRLTTLLESATKVLLEADAGNGREDRRILCWPERLDIGFVVPREAGGLGIRVAFSLSEDGGSACFVVGPLDGSRSTFEPLSLPLATIIQKEMTNGDVTHEVTAMIKKTRASAAH